MYSLAHLQLSRYTGPTFKPWTFVLRALVSRTDGTIRFPFSHSPVLALHHIGGAAGTVGTNNRPYSSTQLQIKARTRVTPMLMEA